MFADKCFRIVIDTSRINCAFCVEYKNEKKKIKKNLRQNKRIPLCNESEYRSRNFVRLCDRDQRSRNFSFCSTTRTTIDNREESFVDSMKFSYGVWESFEKIIGGASSPPSPPSKTVTFS